MSVIVVGSANLDRVFRVERIPGPGETVLATSAAEHCGGKGNNQVIAAARAGASATFVAALGDDDAARTLTGVLDAAGVQRITRMSAEPTGLATITVDDAGENCIVVSPGANAALTGLTPGERTAIEGADVLLMQLEIPLDTVVEAAEVARAAGTLVVLNAAPIQHLPAALVAAVDLLIVNEHEAAELAASLAGIASTPQSTLTPTPSPEADAAILAGLCPAVIVTLGSRGSLIVTTEAPAPTLVPSHAVTAVDTTGAGDTFCGALVAALDAAPGPATVTAEDLASATRFATAAAALAVQKPGAVSAIPTLTEINEMCAS